jgi:predicted NAD/FAD-dependent oxidoreductase
MAFSAASTPLVNVCILGGGIGGCSALKSLLETTSPSVALIEMGRGLGGRSSTRLSREDERIQINHGAPMADVRTPDGLHAFKCLEEKGIARQIQSRDSSAKYFVGDPNMSSLCQGLVDGISPKPTFLFQTMVQNIEPIMTNGKVTNWLLKDKNDEVILTTDWLVVSGSGVAHSRWTDAFGGEPPLVKAAGQINNKDLDGALQCIGDIGSKPVQVAIMAFENTESWGSVTTDTSIVETPDNHILDKLVFRRSSDGSIISVVAHSTTKFACTAADVFGSKSTAARIGGASSSSDREEEVLGALMTSVNAELQKIIGDECAEPMWGPFLHRWGNAFPSGSALSLENAVIGDARVAFCGDYVGERFGSIEGALLSGMRVGKKVGKLVQ